MKDEEAQTPAAVAAAKSWKKEGTEGGANLLFGKGRYKFLALTAILLLAFWSMLTGSVTLRWSAGNLHLLSDDLDSPIHRDLDILELEEREKVVRHMWDIYTHSNKIRLPRFWSEAFKAAYEDLISEVPGVKNAAISEIARMSLGSSVGVEPPPVPSKSTTPISKQLEEAKKTATIAPGQANNAKHQ